MALKGFAWLLLCPNTLIFRGWCEEAAACDPARLWFMCWREGAQACLCAATCWQTLDSDWTGCVFTFAGVCLHVYVLICPCKFCVCVASSSVMDENDRIMKGCRGRSSRRTPEPSPPANAIIWHRIRKKHTQTPETLTLSLGERQRSGFAWFLGGFF